MGWVAQFRHHIRRIDQGLNALTEDYVVLDKTNEEQELIQILRDSTKPLSPWAHEMPDNDVFWTFVRVNTLSMWPFRLDNVSTSLEILLLLREPFFAAADPLQSVIEVIQEDLKAVFVLKNDLFSEAESQSFPGAYEPRPPFVIVGEFCLLSFGALAQSLNSFDIAGWPLAFYHRNVQTLFRSLLNMLFRAFRSERANLVVKRMPRFFEMTLTHPALHFRPEIWAEIAGRDITEPLYEIGAELEPLTWDEGQGEGVIVRLPWATS